MCLGRDVSIWATSATPMVNVAEDSAARSIEIPPAEWVRAGCYAIQEAYFELATRDRRVWGIGVTAPGGWIALDFNYKPLCPLRLLEGDEVTADLARWRERNPRQADRIAVVLAPKDYFRFAISGGLATDVTDVDRLGWLRHGETEWSERRLSESGIGRDQVPPIFDSHAPTGRLSEAGMAQTSLPGGTWVVAGAHETAAGIITAADLRTGTLWITQRADRPPVAARGVKGLDSSLKPPATWSLTRSAIAGYQVFEKALSPAPEAELTSTEVTDPLVDTLMNAGYEIDEVVLTTASPAVGAAALAAVGSGLVRDWERYYRALKEQEEEKADEADEADEAGEEMTNDE